MVHETNFRESITMLVIQDKKHESELSASDSDKSAPDEMQQPTFRDLVSGRRDEETEALLQQQQYLQNIHAAKTFLKMGEPRDSYGSAQDSIRDNLTSHKKSSNPTEKGLTE